MKYKTIVTIVTLIIIAFIVGCNPTPPSGESDPSNKPGQQIVDPVPPDPPKPDLLSFAYRTKHYDVLSVQKSKDWLRKNYWTVTYSGSTIILQRNYKSGNGTDRSKVTISGNAVSSINGTMFTMDDSGNIRVGFFKEDETE